MSGQNLKKSHNYRGIKCTIILLSYTEKTVNFEKKLEKAKQINKLKPLKHIRLEQLLHLILKNETN
jgi:hypothetical protein